MNYMSISGLYIIDAHDLLFFFFWKGKNDLQDFPHNHYLNLSRLYFIQHKAVIIVYDLLALFHSLFSYCFSYIHTFVYYNFMEEFSFVPIPPVQKVFFFQYDRAFFRFYKFELKSLFSLLLIFFFCIIAPSVSSQFFISSHQSFLFFYPAPSYL